MKSTRRSFLAAAAGIGVGSLAGCLDGPGQPGDGTEHGAADVTASFAVLTDFTTAVCGDALAVDGVVPFGQHGHGWQPSADVQRDIRSSSAFVYVGEGFQPWADDVVAGIEEDGADVVTVSAREGVDLLSPAGTGSHDHGHEESGEHGEDHGHEEGNHSEEEHGHGENGTHQDRRDESDEHDGDGHDHEGGDPHFWLDPTRAATSVQTIAAGLAEVFADDADAVRSNADEYVSELESLDARFEEDLSGRSKEAVLVAGHNAFQYLGERYGFEVYTLTDLSPDDQPTTGDVRRAQEIIERENIEHVLAPVLESDRAANQLVAETDATEALPITTMAGRTEEWAENDWGYVDVMTEVNLSSLRTALDA